MSRTWGVTCLGGMAGSVGPIIGGGDGSLRIASRCTTFPRPSSQFRAGIRKWMIFMGLSAYCGTLARFAPHQVLQFRNVRLRIDLCEQHTAARFPAFFDTVYNYSISFHGETEPLMKANYSIAEIEQAINYWTSHQAADSHWSLCQSARALANVYGEMIYRRETNIAADALNTEQSQAIETALHQMELGLAP
ncbi:DUF3717 domain-containing protein [Pandoraea apista]|uniref:DUF3717 domain-containing protein n=1 Tax=Pandoraea apista TaxID=93218 RepID=UPI001E616342|nr:DUF3717 domain-containing protein [Pandoraea apista]